MSPLPLTRREIGGYGLGEMGFNIDGTTISTFLLFFSTDVVGISVAAAAAMFFGVKIFNAFTDPLTGALADRTRTRWGQFRPFLLFMPLPLAVAGVLTYATHDVGPTGNLALACITYLQRMTLYTSATCPTAPCPACSLATRESAMPSTHRASLRALRAAPSRPATLPVLP